MAKRRRRGPDVFDSWYAEHWGDRWLALREALLQPVSHLAWWNPWSVAAPEAVLPEDTQPSSLVPGCYEAPSFPSPPLDANGRPAYYLLDGASAMVSLLWEVEEGETLLDLCAAPGGKALQLAAALWQHGGALLVANELSRARFHRLHRVLASYLPADFVDAHLRLTRHDAQKWCLHETDAYDRILLDAPCSSERHLLHQEGGLTDWSPARSRQLAQRQYTMLVSALDVVRVGGTILYATCSISPLENDGVLAKLAKKRPSRFERLVPTLPLGEPTAWGHLVLPDQGGWGPLYLALLRRTT